MQKLLNFRRLGHLAVVLALCLAVAQIGLGQTDTGQITGTVTDATGAVVAGAKAVAKSTSSGTARETETTSAGVFAFPGLRPDTYEVTVSMKGFETVVRRVDLTVGANLDASVRLKIGNATTTVEVVGTTDVNSVNTENQTLSQTITEQQLAELPTSPTRNPYALVGISGNVAEDNSSGRGAGYAINGMRSSSTNILLDGAENVDTFTADVGQTVPLDSVQEFSVLTNNFGAEYGRASGGVVNLVTKSGTNSFHGSAYEYNRVSKLSSNTFQNGATGTKKGVFTRNDFGFSLGGPIKKDKLFFFNNTEWIRVRSSAPQTYNILDPSSYSLLDSASQAYFAAFGKLAPGVQTLGSGPCDTGTNPGSSLTCDAIRFNAPSDAGGGNPENLTMEVARVDWNISDKTAFFGRYASYKLLDFPGVVTASPYVGYNTGETNYDQNYEFTFAHFFTPTFGNTAKAIYNRLNGPVQPLGTNPAAPTLYIDGAVSSTTVAGNSNPMIFPGYSQTTPGNGIPFGGPQNLYQFHDDLNWTKGKHQFKFGGQFIQIRDNRTFGAYENPVELLGTSVHSGFANLIAGQIYQFQGAVYPQGKFPCVKDPATGKPIVTPDCTLTLPVSAPAFNRNYRYNDGAWYVQDAWKVIPRFTLNLGLRWEYFGVQHNANTALDSNFVLGSGSTIFDQVRAGSVHLAKDGGVFWKPDYKNYAPRVGFAWDVFGDGKTSLRGGYSLGYERNFGNVTFNAIQNPPNYAVISLINASVHGGVGDVPTMPVYTDKAGPLAGTGTKALPAVSQRAIDQHIKTAYAETYNLSIDRSIGKGVFSVAYAGSHGLHLYDIANYNPSTGGGLYLGDARFANRLNYQYSNMNYRSDHGYSHYNALNVKYAVTNFANKGLGLTANYTFSHALDNLSSTFTETFGGISGAYQLGYLDAFNPKLNFGNADFDIRHRFNLAATWDVPWMKNASNKVVRNVLGGWGMGTILNIRSGSPFTLYDCTNINDTSCPLYVPASAIPRTGSSVAIPTAANLFNYIPIPDGGSNLGVSLGMPTCTGLHHIGCTYTTDGSPYPERNQFWGPNYWNMDMNFYKTFTLTERFKLQFRGELYNIFNHSNAYVTGLNLDVSSMSTPIIQTEKGGIYGYPGQPNDERRNIQFALRLMF